MIGTWKSKDQEKTTRHKWKNTPNAKKERHSATPSLRNFLIPWATDRYWSPYMSVNQCCQYLITAKTYVDFRSSLYVRLVYPEEFLAPGKDAYTPETRSGSAGIGVRAER